MAAFVRCAGFLCEPRCPAEVTTVSSQVSTRPAEHANADACQQLSLCAACSCRQRSQGRGPLLRRLALSFAWRVQLVLAALTACVGLHSDARHGTAGGRALYGSLHKLP